MNHPDKPDADDPTIALSPQWTPLEQAFRQGRDMGYAEGLSRGFWWTAVPCLAVAFWLVVNKLFGIL